MSKEEIIEIIDDNTIQISCYAKVYDRESFARGFLIALLETYEIDSTTFDELWELFENGK